ncbi:MAG: AMP-binding protein [Burkholderiales bacterium]
MTPDPALDTSAAVQLDAEPRLLALVRELAHHAQPELAARFPVALGSRLERDLGLDSLARVELGLRVEREFDVRLPENLAAEAETPADLLRALRAAQPGKRSEPVSFVTQRSDVPEALPVAGRPDDARTLLDVLDWHVVRHADRVHATFLASDDEAQTLTYGELRGRARLVAFGLQRAGIAPREAVAIMLPSGLDFFATYCGILMAGGVPVPIYPPFRMSTIEDHLRRQAGILANCLATALVTVPEAKLLARLLRADVPSLRQVVTVRELERDAAEPAPFAARPGDIAFLQYTSGSTGNPKGVILTHANLLANLRAMGRAAGVGSDDVFVSWLPLYHDMGLIGAWMGSLYFAMHLVLMSPLAFLSRPSRWLHAIHAWRGTVSAAPNFAFELLASRVDARDLAGLDLSSWRWAFNGAEGVSADTLVRFAERFHPMGFDPRSIAPVYGLAECALDLAFPPSRRGALVDHVDRERLMATGRAVAVAPGDPRAVKIVACGRALEGCAIRIADREGRSLADRVEGRVEFKGPSATQGYYRNPEATAALKDGEWLDSGDLGYLAAGELFITGRAKDMIIRGGHNIYPYELEEAVGKLPGIRNGCVAVFGVVSPGAATERLVVLAETREEAPARCDALRAAINNLAVDLIGGPADEIVLAPPHAVLKTSSGKIRRAATRDSYQRGLVGRKGRAAWLQLARLAGAGVLARGRHAFIAAGRMAYGAWFWTVFGAVAVLALMSAFGLPEVRQRRAASRRLSRALAKLAGVPIELEGAGNLPAGPFALVANHVSFADVFVLLASVPRDLTFVAKSEYARHWFVGPVLERVGTRFVERFEAGRSVADARELCAAVRAGESLAFFPEGTFRREPGVLSFRTGAFAAAVTARVPVVPVTLVGARTLLPEGQWIPTPTAVRVIIDAPLMPEGEGWKAAVKLRNAARAVIIARSQEPDAAGELAPVFAAR